MEQAKAKFAGLSNRARKRLAISGVSVGLLAMSAGTFAEMSAEEQAVLTMITDKVADYTAPVLAVCAAVLGLRITVRFLMSWGSRLGKA